MKSSLIGLRFRDCFDGYSWESLRIRAGILEIECFYGIGMWGVFARITAVKQAVGEVYTYILGIKSERCENLCLILVIVMQFRLGYVESVVSSMDYDLRWRLVLNDGLWREIVL